MPAFAKLHHSYQNLEGGWIDDALVDLAGGVAERIRWSDEKTKSAMHDGSLFAMLLKYHEQGFLLGAGSPVGASDSEADASPWGIVQSHAYSVLALASIDGLQLIHVRNPWGRKVSKLFFLQSALDVPIEVGTRSSLSLYAYCFWHSR